MAHIYAIDGIVPVVHPTAFVCASATLIGDVIVGPECYVGPCASLRGDFGRLVLMTGSNVQDCAVLHGGSGADTTVGMNAIVSHGAVLHGCTIGENALIGINSVVLDGATIGAQAFIAAMSLVTAGFNVPARTLARGSPAQVVREINANELSFLTIGSKTYRELATRSLRASRLPEPLWEMSETRKKSRVPKV